MAAEDAPPDFDGIYFDTNVLVRGQGWPSPSIPLNNVLRFAAWWGVSRFIPEPVLREAEEHWLRGVKGGVSGLSGAKNELKRLASPLTCETNIEHPTIEKLLEEYRNKVDAAVKDYGITRTPFTNRTVEEVFGFGTKYFLPFAPKGEGKGFQDAVILLSILDHLAEFPNAKAVFISSDVDFKGVDFAHFIPRFDCKRLRVLELSKVFNELWEPYIHATFIKPYRREVESAQAAAKALIPELKQFVQSHLTEEMLSPGLGDTVLKILSIDDVWVSFVETPVPKTEESLDRSVTILIKLSATCTVLVKRDSSYFNLGLLAGLYAAFPREQSDAPSRPEELQIQMTWSGGIAATADIVDSQFKNVVLQALVSEKENK
jgi:hypothetical protein